MVSLNVNISACRYQGMLGVGGIGTGVFFSLNGNHTLGREESRTGHFIDCRDYCKLHIITHYVQTLLGAEFVTLPIGRIGADEAGKRLLYEMGSGRDGPSLCATDYRIADTEVRSASSTRMAAAGI